LVGGPFFSGEKRQFFWGNDRRGERREGKWFNGKGSPARKEKTSPLAGGGRERAKGKKKRLEVAKTKNRFHTLGGKGKRGFLTSDKEKKKKGKEETE